MLSHGHAKDVRSLLGHGLLPGPAKSSQTLHVRAVALDHLNKTSLVRPALPIDVHPRGVVEGDLDQVLGRLAPPGILLGPVAVAAGQLLGRKPDHGDEAAVVGDAEGRAQPAVGTWLEFNLPAVQLGAESVRVSGLALNDLDEHAAPWRWPTTDRPNCSRGLGLVKRQGRRTGQAA